MDEHMSSPMLRRKVLTLIARYARRSAWRVWAVSSMIGLAVALLLMGLVKVERFLPVFFYLAPGALCSLAITGGHGGTEAQDLIGRVVELFVNWGVYTVGVAGVLCLVRRHRDRRKLDI